MEQNIKYVDNTNGITGTKTDQTVLSFEELKALRERKLTPEEADFSEESSLNRLVVPQREKITGRRLV